MTTDTIRLFQVDDWAYVVAKSPEDAAAFIAKDYDRPEDPDECDMEEVNPACDAKMDIFFQQFIRPGAAAPALIAIDGH